MKRKKRTRDSTPARLPFRAANDRVTTIIISVSLLAITWIAFGQTLGHDFVNYDDDQYVYENPRITNGLSPEGIGWALTHVHAGNWHPLTTISHMLDCQLYGLEPWGHHFTNVLLHGVAVVFLFLALRELTAAKWLSAFVAALFAIHPLRIESVAWVAERKDVLSGVLFILTLWAYARYVRSGRRGSGRYITVIVLFALGLMCKPTLVTLPFVLLLLDYWPLRRVPPKSLQDLVIEKIPLFVLSVLSCVATLLAQEGAVAANRLLPVGDRVGNALISYLAYIGQMFWPANLSVVYPHPVGGINGGQAILALVVMVVVSVVFFIWRAKHPYLLVGWLWFLGVLVPMIGIIQVGAQARADRYTYLAQIGLYILITWGAFELFSKWRGGRVILIAAGALVVTALTVDSYFEASFWQNSEMLWNHALKHTSANHIAESNLGNAFMTKGQLDEAIVHFRKALEIDTDYPEAYYNLGCALANKGSLNEAISSYRSAMRVQPNYPKAQNNLGKILMDKGQLDEAIVHFKKALASYTDYPEANNNLGVALTKQGNWADAITSFRVATRVRPNYAEAHNNLANSLAASGKTDEAIGEFREALRLNSDYQNAHCNLAMVLLKLGRRDEAVTHLKEALRLKPDDAEVIAQLRQLGVGR